MKFKLKIPKLVKKKGKKKLKEEELYEDYKKGKFLQIDNNINNKEYLASIN